MHNNGIKNIKHREQNYILLNIYIFIFIVQFFWSKICLNNAETECKKRWRSLRDSFIKLQRTHGGRTRWPYLHAMRFLLPHVEPKNDVPYVFPYNIII